MSLVFYYSIHGSLDVTGQKDLQGRNHLPSDYELWSSPLLLNEATSNLIFRARADFKDIIRRTLPIMSFKQRVSSPLYMPRHGTGCMVVFFLEEESYTWYNVYSITDCCCQRACRTLLCDQRKKSPLIKRILTWLANCQINRKNPSTVKDSEVSWLFVALREKHVWAHRQLLHLSCWTYRDKETLQVLLVGCFWPGCSCHWSHEKIILSPMLPKTKNLWKLFQSKSNTSYWLPELLMVTI